LCEILYYIAIATGKMGIAEALVLPSAFCNDLMLLASLSGAVWQICACHVPI